MSLHCMIAWGVAQGAPALTATDHEAMESGLAGEDWVRAFPGVVVITVNDDAHRYAIEQRLVAVSRDRLDGRALFLISPPITPGTGIYRGYLPQAVWEPLNKKTVPVPA